MAAKAEAARLEAGGREVVITSPHKVLFPEAGHTKLDLAQYYLAVADGALRAAGGRPNVLVRHPNGVGLELHPHPERAEVFVVAPYRPQASGCLRTPGAL